MLTTGHLPSRHPVVVGTGRVVGGCGGGADGGRGGSRTLPATGGVARRGGDAPVLAPFPVPGGSMLFALLRVDYHMIICWGLTHGCLRAWPGGRPRVLAASCGRHPVDARRRMCAVSDSGLFVEVYAVDCVLRLGAPGRPVSIAESQPALKVSFNRPRPRSQPARAGGPGRRARGCPACLFLFTAINF